MAPMSMPPEAGMDAVVAVMLPRAAWPDVIVLGAPAVMVAAPPRMPFLPLRVECPFRIAVKVPLVGL